MPSPKQRNHEIIFSTQHVTDWRDDRQKIQPANWLTGPIANLGLLPVEYRDTRIAPIVIGIGTPVLRNTANDPRTGYLAFGVDTDGLSQPHNNEDFNAHAALKRSTEKQLDKLIPKELTRRKKPDITSFAGYVLPDMARGTVYLEGFESYDECSRERLLPAGIILADTFGLENVFVGGKIVKKNEHGFDPLVSMPALIRNALNHPDKKLPLSHRLKECARYLLEIER